MRSERNKVRWKGAGVKEVEVENHWLVIISHCYPDAMVDRPILMFLSFPFLAHAVR
jgi:hypothetical protein